MPWFITGVVSKESSNSTGFKSSKCFGFYNNYLTAKTAITNDVAGLCECRHTHIVLEYIEEGLYAHTIIEEWWKRDSVLNAWRSCDKPKNFDGLINWAIG